MKLTLESLKEIGAFVQGAPEEREITWSQGDQEFTATVYVKRMAYKTAVSELKHKDQIAARIASSICDAEGNAVFTPEIITGEVLDEDGESMGELSSELTYALLDVIADVNGLKKKKS